MTTVAVVYHSAFGHTRVIAERVALGADAVAGVTGRAYGVETLPAPAGEQGYVPAWAPLHEADAIIFGCPTYMGSVSAAFKAFMDSTSALWFTQRWKDKIAGGFTCAGGLSGNKENTLQTLITFAAQHGMMWVPLGVMPSAISGEGDDLNRMSAWLGAMAQASGESPEVTPPESDRRTAELYGRRVADAAVRWRHGAGV